MRRGRKPYGVPAVVHAVVPAVVLATALCASPSLATERRFTYTYESLVLEPGEVEIEPWTTFRLGREDFYSRLDQRIEFEAGLSERLQMAWYLNMTAVTSDVEPDVRETEFEWGGVSSEWKYKLRDPVADPFGLALYLELGASTTEAELEGKLIVDKRAGDFLAAFNAVVEPEWHYDTPETESEVNFEFDLGLAHFVSQTFALGLEVRNHNGYTSDDGWEYSALFAGPVVSYSSGKWWTAVTVLPQIAKLKGTEEDEDNNLVLSEREKLETRVIFGFHL